MEKEQKEYLEMQEDDRETNEDLLAYEGRMGKNYPSDYMPQDFYQYKKIVLIPESQVDFPNVVDKDVVLANLSKGEIEELSFQVGTVQAVKDMFVQETTTINPNPDGRTVFQSELVFDDAFLPVLNILLSTFKYRHVASRAVGETRASMLDTMTTSRVLKEFTKGRKNRNSAFGI